MDQRSFVIANLLVRNPDNAAVLETTLPGLMLQALTKITISITGADLDPWLNDRPAPQWTAFTMREGDALCFKKRKRGLRAYLAVQGGVDVPEVLGSRSTYVRGKIGALPGKGDTLSNRLLNLGGKGDGLTLPEEYRPDFDRAGPIRVIMGPQDDYFTPRGIETFLNSTYRISPQADRQGFRTEGPAIEIAKGPDIISDPIPLGAVQVTGDGRPVILLRDAQATGGYAKIAIVARVEMDSLGQMVPGNTVRFQRIDRQKALELLHEETQCLNRIRDLLK